MVAQPDHNLLFVKDAIKVNKIKLYNNITKNSIAKNLSLPLNDRTEEYWLDAFWSMELIQYHSLWADSRINIAFDSSLHRSIDFQRALLELAYTNYKNEYAIPIKKILETTTNEKIFAMCSEYLLKNNSLKETITTIQSLLCKKFNQVAEDPIIKMLHENLNYHKNYLLGKTNIINDPKPILKDILDKQAFSNSVVVYSFQRKNRNYPGIAIVRDKDGNFVKEENGNLFYVPQLARSITDLPGYLTNGNTPQGIFRMDGLDVSKSNFIGPTPNIQLKMPFEDSIAHFIKDSTVLDSVWSVDFYQHILPASWKNYLPIFQTYYASQAGRTEIIAHGTTVNPEYYKNQPYYPHTPTQGCLCTIELWSEEDGRRLQSDQQKLVDAVTKAGGPDGYLVVIELDDNHEPVTIKDILPYLPKP